MQARAWLFGDPRQRRIVRTFDQTEIKFAGNEIKVFDDVLGVDHSDGVVDIAFTQRQSGVRRIFE